MQKKKILFILPSLFGGGAERVVLTLLHNLDRNRFIPMLALVKREGKYLKDVPEDVELIDLQVTQARYALFKIIKLLKKERPDLLFTSLAHLNLLIALIRPLFPKSIRFIARESNTVSENNKRDKYPRINALLYKRVYNNYDAIVTQAKAMRDDLEENYGISPEKMHTIHNPVDIEAIREKTSLGSADLPQDKCNLLAVGRLSDQKGFDMLLRIVARLDARYYLTILGEGEKEEELKAQIKALKLEDRVRLFGFCDNPYPYMKSADLLVLSSRYEGLPNVVLEANSLGTPVVAFDSSGGTGEIVKDGLNGYLVKAFDEEAFARAIEKACKEGFDAREIENYIEENFSVKKIIQLYEKLFSRN